MAPPLTTVIHVWAPAFRPFGGGIAAFSRELATALSGLGHRLALFGRDDQAQDWQGAPLRGAGRRPAWARQLAFALQLLTLAWRERPAIVISTHVNFAPVALLAKWLVGTRYVVVAHGIDVHPALSWSRALALRKADAVWAVSRWTRERALALGVEVARIEVIGNTVDSDNFTLAPAGSEVRDEPALRAAYGITHGSRVLLTVARLDAAERYKGYDTVLRALPALQAHVPGLRYLIVGTGSDQPRIEALATELGVRDRVTFCGFVAEGELARHFRVADAFVMPSRGEGFGIVFLEAMACGTPVVGGDEDGTRDALADGALGRLVDPGDATALAGVLAGLLRGEGPATWFDPPRLRAECLALHGRPAFAQRIRGALARAGVPT